MSVKKKIRGDKIIIEDAEAQCHVGLTAAERAQPQRIFLSVEMEFDLANAGRRDAIKHTVDYAQVIAGMRDQIEHTRFVLIEAVAEHLSSWLLAKYPIKSVSLQAMKTPFKDVGKVGVRVRRKKQNGKKKK
jgi:dihydroneopterin aldolase